MVIDNHLPRQPLISSYVPDWPLPPRVYIPSESEMALRARIYAYNRHLSFDVAFICSTLTHCGVCHLNVWRLKWEVSYVHQNVWRWKWFFCQSNYVLQRLRLCRTSDTVFRREIDSRRQWGYGTCYGGIVSPLRRSVAVKTLQWNLMVILRGEGTSLVYRTHTSWAISFLLGAYSTHITQVCRQLEPHIYSSCLPSTHHCWFGQRRYGMRSLPAVILLHMTGSDFWVHCRIHYATCPHNSQCWMFTVKSISLRKR